MFLLQLYAIFCKDNKASNCNRKVGLCLSFANLNRFKLIQNSDIRSHSNLDSDTIVLFITDFTDLFSHSTIVVITLLCKFLSTFIAAKQHNEPRELCYSIYFNKLYNNLNIETNQHNPLKLP